MGAMDNNSDLILQSDAVFIVAGTVRRGAVMALASLPEYTTPVKCDGDPCHNWAVLVVASPKGRTTFLCADCLVLCGPPKPTCVGSVLCDDVAKVRGLVARGQFIGDSRKAFAEAEKYEKAKLRWARQTRKHGFKKTVAKPHHNRSIWNMREYNEPIRPSTQKGGAARILR